MKVLMTLFILTFVACSCGGRSASTPEAPNPSAPQQYGYRVIATHPHLTTSYTQGLQYVNGVLWEGTGQHGASVLQQVDLLSGKATIMARLPREEFGEGITIYKDKVYQLTWQSNTVHIYDVETASLLRDLRYPGEGWGLTTDGTKLYMSNGTASLYTVNPETFAREKSVTVTLEGEPVIYLNELEWIEGKIWANVYTTDKIVIIEPTTGVVEGVVDLTGLLPIAEITADTDVLNGIAYDTATKRIFVTGKNWSKLFEIALVAQD
ncbi:MAG: glutaminyl-peptide cyclotransferase [Alistipes sp.]